MDGFMLVMAILAALWLFCVGCFALVLMMDEVAYRMDRRRQEREKREKESAGWKRKK